MQVLVSLHDVTPAHQARLERAEALLTRAGVTHAAYFIVPEFHGAHAVACDPAFQAWCARPRPFDVEWVLHGYSHQDEGFRSAGLRAIGDAVKRRLLTGGEGEFLALDAGEQRVRVRRGLEAVSFLRQRPAAFVAPAWLFNDTLLPVLAGEGIPYSESHRHVFDISRGVAHRCPVLTWATRTWPRRAGSRLLNPIHAALLQAEPAIRLALHPHDFDHPRTAHAIERLLAMALRERETVGYAALCGRP